MHADKRTRTVTHHEWTLPSPAHSTEVEKAIATARTEAKLNLRRPVDIWISCDDDKVVIGYSVEQTPTPNIPAQRDSEQLKPVPAPLRPDGRPRCTSQYAAEGTHHQCERTPGHAGYHRADGGLQWNNGDQA